MMCLGFLFFFQAEDGIRDVAVTGVQTCALPISFLGAYPYRRVPGTAPEAVLRAMERVGIDEAWVTHLPGLFWQAPPEGNAWLYETTARERRLKPVPAVHPGLAGWEEVLGEAGGRGPPAGRGG